MIIYRERHSTPPANRLLIAYCEDWNDCGYQICKYRESGFYYEDQPNDIFDQCVTHWAFLHEFN